MTDAFEPRRFLSRYWQKQAVFLPGILPENLPALDPDELAWLATQADVESRIILTEQQNGRARYRLETGPFTRKALTGLPRENWALLVQDVEKHLPAFRRFLDEVAFIPDWRIDDLMISCAAPGGSVGPHVDSYDVFLCQGIGRRHWTIGRPGDGEPDLREKGLELLEPFAAAAEYCAAAGDVLYLPPGIPHCGVAESLCMTMSIGCLAPTRRELQRGRERVLGKRVPDVGGSDDQKYYADPDLEVSESEPGMISRRSIERIRAQALLDGDLSELELARVLGSVVTDPKAWLAPASATPEQIRHCLEAQGTVAVHGMARLAWIELPEAGRVFLNGNDHEVTPATLDVVRAIWRSRQLTRTEMTALERTRDGEELLRWMAEEGLFDADHGEE